MITNIHVSKFGSSLIADPDVGIFQKNIDAYVARTLSNTKNGGHIFVVSGARAVGIYQAHSLRGQKTKNGLSDKQLSGIGAVQVFNAFEKACAKVGKLSASFPITHHLLEAHTDEKTVAERESFVDVLKANAANGIISIINEADAMNDKELMRLLFGFSYEIDNDLLAAHIAKVAKAKTLTLWKKEGGLMEENGRYISTISDQTLDHYRQVLNQRASGSNGRGGPATTLDALELAARSGVDARVAGITDDMTGVNVTRLVLG